MQNSKDTRHPIKSEKVNEGGRIIPNPTKHTNRRQYGQDSRKANKPLAVDDKIVDA
jgi:hypothetical protein